MSLLFVLLGKESFHPALNTIYNVKTPQNEKLKLMSTYLFTTKAERFIKYLYYLSSLLKQLTYIINSSFMSNNYTKVISWKLQGIQRIECTSRLEKVCLHGWLVGIQYHPCFPYLNISILGQSDQQPQHWQPRNWCDRLRTHLCTVIASKN